DGIRDGHVTGVQTCALPIWVHAPCRRCSGRKFRWPSNPPRSAAGRSRPPCSRRSSECPQAVVAVPLASTSFLGEQLFCAALYSRSEERRVGKECRVLISAD